MDRDREILDDLERAAGRLQKARPEAFLYDSALLAKALFESIPQVGKELDRAGAEALDRLRGGDELAHETMSRLGCKRANNELLLAMYWAHARTYHLRAEAAWDPNIHSALADDLREVWQELKSRLDAEMKMLDSDGLRGDFHPSVRLNALSSRLRRIARAAELKSRELLIATGHKSAGRPFLDPTSRTARLDDVFQVEFLGIRPSALPKTQTYAETTVQDFIRNKRRSNQISRNLKALNRSAVEWYDQFKQERRAVWDQIDA